MTYDPEKLAQELRTRGDAWADADAAWRALDEATKSVFSECRLKYKEGTQGDRDALAYCDPAYRGHLEALAEARKRCNRAKVAYDTWNAYLEMKRTQQSNLRAEMQAYK